VRTKISSDEVLKIENILAAIIDDDAASLEQIGFTPEDLASLEFEDG
jgi:hypothetical protein